MPETRSGTTATQPHYVTVDEALRELHIHRSTLYRLQKSGALTPHKRAGDRKVYYEHQQIEALKQLHPRDSRPPNL